MATIHPSVNFKNKKFTIGDLLDLEKQGYCINFRDGMIESIFKPEGYKEDNHGRRLDKKS